jgi:hypothetical protein
MSNDYENEQLEIIKNKINVFKETEIAIHLFLKDGQWRRGEIKEVYDDYFMLDERIMGRIPIFFVDISGVDKIRVKR